MKKLIRRRGSCIVETPNGILLASGRRKVFLLPGGGANKNESRQKAAIRELEEETGLKTTSCEYLFTYNENEKTNDNKKFNIIDLHKVFLIKAEGELVPNYEDVSFIDYYSPDLNVSNTTKNIIKQFKELK